MFKNETVLVIGAPVVAQFMRSSFDVVHVPNAHRCMHDLIPEVELIVFTGGADVHPKMYGHTKHTRTNVSEYRDQQEAEVYKLAATSNVPMVGICRGAQFLTVMNNGTLYQDIDGHLGDHPISIVNPNNGSTTTINASSTHHQMMNPFALPEDEYIILGYPALNLSKIYKEHVDGTEVLAPEPDIEPEVVLYPYTNSLAFQPHPEYTSRSYDAMKAIFIEYCKYLIAGTTKLEKLGAKVPTLDTDKLMQVELFGNVKGE